MGLDQWLSKNGETEISWRKENHLHRWFSDNTDYEDEVVNPSSPFGVDKLNDLVNTIEEVIADNSKAEELLPTQEGFFFGSTDYDEWYFTALSEEVRELKELIAKHTEADTYVYSTWW